MQKKIKKILFVDDEIGIFKIIKNSLKNEHNIDYAPDGKKGFLLFKKNHYDILITDFNMPEMDGKELIDKIRNINDKIPIILLTGNTSITMEGITIIYKPFDINFLKCRIENLSK